MIKLLSQYLKKDGHTAINYEDNADTKIVEAALDFACEKNVTVFAEDIYIYDTFVHGRNFHESQQKEESNSKVGDLSKRLERH